MVCAIPRPMQTLGCLRIFRLRLVVAALLVSACQPANDPQVSNDTVSNETARLPRLPVAEAPLNREAILHAAAKAASATALRQNDQGAQRGLDGNRFEARIRFGCPTSDPGVENSPFEVRYDAESRRLQVRASLDLTEAEPWVAALGAGQIEAVEGFWMRKPWLLAAGCSEAGGPSAIDTPKNTGDSPSPATKPASVWRVGVAQFFGATETRTTRRDHRAYETTKTLGEGERPSSQGYDLILSGRLRELPDGRVIACHVASDALPPECVVSAKFDQVRIERADTHETLADWSS